MNEPLYNVLCLGDKSWLSNEDDPTLTGWSFDRHDAAELTQEQALEKGYPSPIYVLVVVQTDPPVFSHTPEPWFHVPRRRDGYVDVITDKNGIRFISVGVPEAEEPILDEPHDNIQTRNARLVAAAPVLLRVCKLIRKGESQLTSGCYVVTPDAFLGVCDAIRLAEEGK